MSETEARRIIPPMDFLPLSLLPWAALEAPISLSKTVSRLWLRLRSRSWNFCSRSSKWKTEDLGRCRHGSDMLRLRSLGSRAASTSCWSVKGWLLTADVEDDEDSAYMASCAGAQSLMGKIRRGVAAAIAGGIVRVGRGSDSECGEVEERERQ